MEAREGPGGGSPGGVHGEVDESRCLNDLTGVATADCWEYSESVFFLSSGSTIATFSDFSAF